MKRSVKPIHTFEGRNKRIMTFAKFDFIFLILAEILLHGYSSNSGYSFINSS